MMIEKKLEKMIEKLTSEENQTLKELKTITKILLLTNAEKLETELGRIATTDNRKKIWVLIDGKTSPEDISKQIDSSISTVRNFLTALERAGLIENPYGEPPAKLIDYVPPKWIELLKPSEERKEPVKDKEEVMVE